MDEQKSKQDTPQENEPPRRVSDPTDGIQQAKEHGRTRHRNGGQSDHYIWGLSWYEFLTLIIGSGVAIVIAIMAYLQWRDDTISTRQKERPLLASTVENTDPDSSIDPSVLLRLRNVGETAALNVYGAWLVGECSHSSSQACIEWCLQPLPEAERIGYGHVVPSGELTKEFFYTMKPSKKTRKKRLPFYFCGYVAYTDKFCMWHRQFYTLFYDPAADKFSSYDLSNREEEAEVENCSPWRLY